MVRDVLLRARALCRAPHHEELELKRNCELPSSGGPTSGSRSQTDINTTRMSVRSLTTNTEEKLFLADLGVVVAFFLFAGENLLGDQA